MKAWYSRINMGQDSNTLPVVGFFVYPDGKTRPEVWVEFGRTQINMDVDTAKYLIEAIRDAFRRNGVAAG